MAELAKVSTKEPGKVMIVDDVAVNRIVLKKIISEMGYEPVLAENGVQALKLLEECSPMLFLLDISMPEMDGYELAQIIKSNVYTRDIPIIFISAYDETEDVVKGFSLGGDDYVTKPFIPEVIKARAGVHIKFYETNKELSEANKRLQASLSNQLKQIESEKMNVLYALAGLARKNSLYDDYYFDRVKYNSRLLAQAMQIAEMHPEYITDNYIDMIEHAAPLCDIGNVAIPQNILQKKDGPLTSAERELVFTHTDTGARILRDISQNGDFGDFMKMGEEIARCHHENWDGTGYPKGLKGADIPLSAQIVSIVTVYCALTSERSYRSAFSKEEALEIIQKDSGVKYNPEIVDLCKRITRQLK